MLKVSGFYNKKVLFLKKNISLAVVNTKTKKLCLLTLFSRRFWDILQMETKTKPDTQWDKITIESAFSVS